MLPEREETAVGKLTGTEVGDTKFMGKIDPHLWDEMMEKRTHKFSWVDVDFGMLGEAVALMTADGVGLLFAATRDGGSLGLTVYRDGTKLKRYFSGPEDLNYFTDTICNHGR